jgi:hypothetical protein
MVWWRSKADHDGAVTTLEFTHSSGSVMLHEAEGRIDDDRLELRGIVDADTWERIQRHDIFGAISRTRSPGELPPGDRLRLTLTTDAVLPTEQVAVPAEWFAVVDAMRSVDVEELKAAGLEGEAWEGIHFSEAPVWGSAVAELAADGFEFIVGDDQSALFRHDEDLATVQLRYRSDVKLVQIIVSSPLLLGDDIPKPLYEAVNGINVVVPWSTTMLDDGDVLLRETVTDDTVDQATLIATRVQEMLGLLWVIRGPLVEVAHGTLTPQAGLETMFN